MRANTEKIKKYGLLYLSIDAVHQMSLTFEMVGWTIVFWLDDLVWNVSFVFPPVV
jgi:hypothetical protein